MYGHVAATAAGSPEQENQGNDGDKNNAQQKEVTEEGIQVVVDGKGLPLGDHLHSASPAEVKLAEKTLATICVGRRRRPGRPRQKPQRVIADGGYDSDPLRERLARRGIELIAPHNKN